MRPRTHLAPLFVATALTSTGCSGPSPEASSAVLITIDTWRGDHLGAGGHPDLRTPHLDRFFRGGLQFSDAFAPIPTTLPSHLSMLTGAWPTEHGVPRNAWSVPGDLRTLPGILLAEGVATAAFVSSAVLDGRTGISRGFGVYDDRITQNEESEEWRPASETVAHAVQWWRETDGRKFLWVHLFEPHLPYRPRPEYASLYGADLSLRDGSATVAWVSSMWADKKRFTPEIVAYLTALYRAEITGMDRQIGPLLREMAEDPSLAVVLTADHGESLGEHRLFFKHGPRIFPADVRVPLVLRHGSVGEGLSAASVRTIDIPGTLLGLLGVDAELPPDADDLRNWTSDPAGLPVFGVASAPHDAPPEVFAPGEYENSRQQRVLRRDGVSYMETPWQGRAIWFDRASDPDELHGRRPSTNPDVADLKADLDTWIQGARKTTPEEGLDPDLAERMRALGYLN